MRLYFSRHGESEANVQRIFWNQPEGYGLTDKGRTQAETLADNLAGIQFAALYCSPVLRAVQTAQIVGQRLDLAPEAADGLREWHTGILEGQGYSKETQSLHWWATRQCMVYDNHDARIEGGESFHGIGACLLLESMFGMKELGTPKATAGRALTDLCPKSCW